MPPPTSPQTIRDIARVRIGRADAGSQVLDCFAESNIGVFSKIWSYFKLGRISRQFGTLPEAEPTGRSDEHRQEGRPAARPGHVNRGYSSRRDEYAWRGSVSAKCTSK